MSRLVSSKDLLDAVQIGRIYGSNLECECIGSDIGDRDMPCGHPCMSHCIAAAIGASAAAADLLVSTAVELTYDPNCYGQHPWLEDEEELEASQLLAERRLPPGWGLR